MDLQDTAGVEAVISFTPDGVVEAMQSDSFPLSFLGKQSIRRATEITFNEESQAWDIALCLYGDDGQLSGYLTAPQGQGFDSYGAARSMEVNWLNYCRLHGLSPASEEGKRALKLLRDMR